MWDRLVELVLRILGKSADRKAAADKAESESIHAEVTAKNHAPPEGGAGGP